MKSSNANSLWQILAQSDNKRPKKSYLETENLAPSAIVDLIESGSGHRDP